MLFSGKFPNPRISEHPSPFFNNQRLAVRESWEADSPKVGMLQRGDVASGL